MTDKFVDYLNSMNSADGNSSGSLAEVQVTNKFYKKIHVKRNLGDYIKKSIENKEDKVFFITGHAGDGKTSILAQILKELGLLDNEGLKEYDEVRNDEYSVFYIKDMSELESEKQEELIKKALSIPDKGGSSIVISNTGPLIKTIKKIDERLESDVIEKLDSNDGENIDIDGKKVSIINLARIDNIDFVDEILEKLIEDDFWTGCENCGKGEVCHIAFNRKLIKKYKTRVSKFIKSYYRWLYENDQRLTIRQIVAHMSYMITANKCCGDIKRTNVKNQYKYIFNLANNLFGFQGITEDEKAVQIEAIKRLRTLNLDKISLDADYELFVKNDYSVLPAEIAEIVESRWSQYERECREEGTKYKIFSRDKSIKIRKCIRRFYLVFGFNSNENKSDEIMNEIFGETFTLYKNCIIKELNRQEIKEVKDIIFNALRKLKFDGDESEKDRLYLTLKRHDGSFQSVMLIVGEVEKKNIEVKSKSIKKSFDDIANKNELYLIKKGCREKEYKLSYQLLEYFNSILKGAIETKTSPMITCGIAKLDSWLMENYKYEEDDNKLELLIKTASGIKRKSLEIEDKKIYVD